MELKLYYATNRRHVGRDRMHPSSYGTKFSDDGMENLRFGVVVTQADDGKVAGYVAKPMKDCGVGDGEGLGSYLATCAKSGNISAYEERLSDDIDEKSQKSVKLGSKALFAEVETVMRNASDVLVYIHGFNVSWEDAVGSAMALQLMLRHAPGRNLEQDVVVVLFTWPSDGLALPWVSYKSDRTEAAGSGAAVGRAFLKVRDYLADIRDKAKKGGREVCGQDIHLLCHSMGNYVLQNALARVADFTPGKVLPRIFEHVFLCAPDVDDNVLEEGQPLGNLDQLTRHVTVYFNREDKAMVVSDYTKGNPDRLGGVGAAHPALLHNKISQVDCTPVVHGLSGHSYYLTGSINADIRASIDGCPQDDVQRLRRRNATIENLWVMISS